MASSEQSTELMTRKERRYQEREAQILHAARSLLREYGLPELTMDRIGEEINYSKAVVYQHFPCKEEIVAAARALMRRSGDVGFSMRVLAEEAGVSIATPYNLFGSKQAILLAVLAADLKAYEDTLAGMHADRIEVTLRKGPNEVVVVSNFMIFIGIVPR